MAKRFLIVAAIAVAIAVSACTATQRQSFWCAYHAARLVHDVRVHARGWAAFQVILAAHHCRQLL